MKKHYLLLAPLLLVFTGCAVAPKPITDTERSERVDHQAATLASEIVPITGVVSLDEAIARAIKHNRERKLQALEAAMAQGQLNLTRFDMLPQLTASAGFTERSNYAASASTRFEGNRPLPLSDDPDYSISQDKTQVTKNVVFSWNVLDFGLSYVRAQQQADRFLIARERERKIIHNITHDVRNAYYRAATAQAMLTQLDPLNQRAQSALNRSQDIERTRTQPPLDALNYQRELLEVLRTLQSLKQEYSSAKLELAVLMGLPPGTDFELGALDDMGYGLPDFELNVEEMEVLALNLRPELMEAQYIERITAKDARAAMLGLLPNLNFTAGAYYDNNQYLRYNDWTSVSAQASWNLFNIFQVERNKQVNEIRQHHAQEQALATAVAVLAQVHLARARLEEAAQTFALSDHYYQVTLRINEQIIRSRQAQRIGEMDEIRENMNLLLAQLRRDLAYAELQNSYGRLLVSMGLDLVDAGFSELELDTLQSSIAQRLNEWQNPTFSQFLTEP